MSLHEVETHLYSVCLCFVVRKPCSYRLAPGYLVHYLPGPGYFFEGIVRASDDLSATTEFGHALLTALGNDARVIAARALPVGDSE